MRTKALFLLAVLLLAFPAGSAAAASPVEMTLPLSFKTRLAAGKSFTFAFTLIDSGGARVWTESKKYKVPANQVIAHRLGSVRSFDLGVGGPVDFSRQLTVEAKSGTSVYRSKLALAPYALWSADAGVRSGSLVIRQLTGQAVNLQEWQNAAGATVAAVAADGTLSAAGGLTTGGAVSAGSIATGGAISGSSLTTSGAVSAGSVTSGGTISAGNFATAGALSAASVTASGTVTAAAFVGDGSGLTNLYLGTAGNAEVQMRVNGAGVLHVDPYDPAAADSSPNVIAGFNALGNPAVGNGVESGVRGASIGGGGALGSPNVVHSHFGTVGGGAGNNAGCIQGTITNALYATVGGGKDNCSSGSGSFVGGGEGNTVMAAEGVVAGGFENRVMASSGAVGGGLDNEVCGNRGTVGGGRMNLAGTNASIAGGDANRASGQFSSIGGGRSNTAGAFPRVDLDPDANGVNDCSLLTSAEGQYATVAGGQNNVASAAFATVPGGAGNTASGDYSFAAGNRAKAWTSGSFVWADNSDALGATFPPEDPSNPGSPLPGIVADNQFLARAAGGFNFVNAVDGTGAPLAGLKLEGAGAYGIAAGHHATTWGTAGSFVWADASSEGLPYTFPPADPNPENPGAPLPGVANNQFWARATGGFFFVTSVDGSGVPLTGKKLDAVGWSDLPLASDRGAKTGIAPVDAAAVLAKVEALPISTWSYKGAGPMPGPKHMGPMAQDFRAAFGLGDDERQIAPVDAAGVSLAAIQGLATLVKELQGTVAALERQLAEQRAAAGDLRLQVADLERRYAQVRALLAASPAGERQQALR